MSVRASEVELPPSSNPEELVYDTPPTVLADRLLHPDSEQNRGVLGGIAAALGFRSKAPPSGASNQPMQIDRDETEALLDGHEADESRDDGHGQPRAPSGAHRQPDEPGGDSSDSLRKSAPTGNHVTLHRS